ncbi:MAG: GIY-YIG nuclease family protein [Terricaulis sp.]
MSNERKRELVREYKERKVRRGVYAVRCATTSEVWASASRNLDAQQNSLFFQLRNGRHPNRALQAAWKAHGEAGFAYEELAELSDEERGDYALKADLKSLEQEWREKLGAKAVTG